MCYTSYRAAVEEEIAARVAEEMPFTAWDITRALREQGFEESHSVLKEVVHCLFRYGKFPTEYRRTFIPVGDGKESAFLFHHRDDDPRAYVDHAVGLDRPEPRQETAWGRATYVLRQAISAGVAADREVRKNRFAISRR